MTLPWSTIVKLEQEGALPQTGLKYESNFIEDTEVVIADKHGSLIHQPTWECFLRWLDENKDRISMITDNGDWSELKEVSRWYKVIEPDKLREDLDAAYEQDSQLRAIFDGPIWKTFGNHDVRWEQAAQGLGSIKALREAGFRQLPEVLDFEAKGIQWTSDPAGFVHRGVRRTHGESVRKEPGQSARMELENWMECGVSGHVHRGNIYRKQHLWWMETPCMQDKATSHMTHTPTWDYGWSLIHHLADGTALPEIINVHEGHVIRF